VGFGVSAAISPRTSMAANGEDSGDRTGRHRSEVGTELDDGWSGAEESRAVDGLAPGRPGLVTAERDSDDLRPPDQSRTGPRRGERGAIEETPVAVLPTASRQDPPNASAALGPTATPDWVGWSGASALADPEETEDNQATSFPEDPAGAMGWRNGEPSLRRVHPRSRPGDVGVQTPHLAKATLRSTSTSTSAPPEPADAQPSPPFAHACTPAFLDGEPSRGGAAGAIWPATVTLTSAPGDSPTRRWLSPTIDGLGPSAPWLSLGSRTFLPRISLLIEGGHGPAGTNLTAYITASFALDRGPLVTSARTTFARIAARHEQAAARQTAAFVRLLGQIAAARCVSAAEQAALVGLWRDAQ
jgi:hypothetical protein